MQGQITLSKKERHYQFFYLILMLITAMLFLGVIFLKGFESPFSDEDVRGIQNLEQKAEFERHQKIVLPIMDSTYTMITKLTDDGPQPFVENNIQLGVNDLNSYFNGTDVVDIRKDAYPQIAKFYKMYFDDKKVISTTSEDIKIFQKQVDECRIGFKDKQNKLYQREQDLKARMQ
ncbi:MULTISPECIES: type VI secretion system transmembrane protein TssO [unclassified Chryseobacterium]|uniref:type VI secretion system transmembrane protein TssO n=1 Tax=unclassified Chryseobacterium TaxID=2593645 RepID=UPI001159ED3B|nr:MULTISPECIES: type VI secretion system transmembrane protein TssO [unclassified Chryseobacterium]MBO9694318.1 type VI secretion system transmembrane protein TssO [Chryseobacterium sp.]